jgi:hypothetical protein
MFFNINVVLNLVKQQVINNPVPGLSHCQMLNAKSQELGFQSYHHLREGLKGLPDDQFGPVSIGLMRRLCETKLPSQDCPYYEFYTWPNKHGEISFYSEWAGWDKYGEEVRVPRPLDGRESVLGLRKIEERPIYVVETEIEVLLWQFRWGAIGYVPEALARLFFGSTFNKERRIEKDPSMDLVKAKSEERMVRIYAQAQKAM